MIPAAWAETFMSMTYLPVRESVNQPEINISACSNSQTISSGAESKIQHLSFTWPIKQVGTFLEMYPRNEYFHRCFIFSMNGGCIDSTWWKIGLDFQKYEEKGYFHVSITRSNIRRNFEVFVDFYLGIVDVDGNIKFSKRIRSIFKEGDEIYIRIVDKDVLLNERSRLLPKDKLTFLCEMTVNIGLASYDYFTSTKNNNVPYEQKSLSEDMRKLFKSGFDSDLTICGGGESIKCHKAVLCLRSPHFTKMLKDFDKEHCTVVNLDMKPGVLHALLEYIYCGYISFCLKRTVPSALYDEAKKYELSELLQQLDSVYLGDRDELKTLNVTWKLTRFKKLILRPGVSFYSSSNSSETFHDNQWRIKLQINDKNSPDYIGIYVIPNNGEYFIFSASFSAKIYKNDLVSYERSSKNIFIGDEPWGFNKFIEKEKVCMDHLSSDKSLTLKCSLDVISGNRNLGKISKHNVNAQCIVEPAPATVFSIKNLNLIVPIMYNMKDQSTDAPLHLMNLNVGLKKLSKDLENLTDFKQFSNTHLSVLNTSFPIHRCIFRFRISAGLLELKKLFIRIKPAIVRSFFTFVYAANIPINDAISLYGVASRMGINCVEEKLSSHLKHILTTDTLCDRLLDADNQIEKTLKYTLIHFIRKYCDYKLVSNKLLKIRPRLSSNIEHFTITEGKTVNEIKIDCEYKADSTNKTDFSVNETDSSVNETYYDVDYTQNKTVYFVNETEVENFVITENIPEAEIETDIENFVITENVMDTEIETDSENEMEVRYITHYH